MANTNPARGMRDFLPSDIRKRNYVIGIIKQVYESYGFEPLETPSVENLETLTGKYGEEGNQLIFKILKRGEKLDINDKELADTALRYDLTVPFSRVVANRKNELPKYFKRYQIQPVWRADRPAKGRFREFYQCDVDAIGSTSMIVEAELISAVCDVLKRLGFEDFTLRLNNRELLREMLNAAGVAENLQTDALVAIDKLDKVGREGVLKEFEERGIEDEAGRKIMDLFAKLERSENTETLEELAMFIGSVTKSVQNLSQILELSNNSNIKIDPSLARGLSYYTGAIMEIVVSDLAGSLAGGGRYDELIGMFGKEQIPACGFSIGLERIIVVMTERGMFPPELQTNSADVFITIWNEESIAESLKLANELRQTGNLRVTVYPEADKLAKQFKYASAINVQYVCVVGESELAEGKVTIKNLANGEQESVERSKVAEYLSNKLV
jgi:histidyl-tRNA synthetase